MKRRSPLPGGLNRERISEREVLYLVELWNAFDRNPVAWNTNKAATAVKRLQVIIVGRQNGWTWRELGIELGISAERAQQSAREGWRQLRKRNREIRARLRLLPH